MNKLTTYIGLFAAVVTVLLTIFFFMWKNESNLNEQLQIELNKAQIEINDLNTYTKQKETEYKKIQTKYNDIVANYKGNECENQPVSVEMIQALREMTNVEQ